MESVSDETEYAETEVTITQTIESRSTDHDVTESETKDSESNATKGTDTGTDTIEEISIDSAQKKKGSKSKKTKRVKDTTEEISIDSESDDSDESPTDGTESEETESTGSISQETESSDSVIKILRSPNTLKVSKQSEDELGSGDIFDSIDSDDCEWYQCYMYDDEDEPRWFFVDPETWTVTEIDYTKKHLKAFYIGGTIDGDTLVWMDGYGDYKALCQVPELQDIIWEDTKETDVFRDTEESESVTDTFEFEHIEDNSETRWFFIEPETWQVTETDFSREEMANIYVDGGINEETLVWTDGYEDYRMIYEVPELQQVIQMRH